MKKALAFVCVLGFVASAAVADVFNATKDNSVLGHSTERLINHGGRGADRVAKWTQHLMAVDFDTAAIKAFEAANPLGPGEYYQAELFLMPSGGWPPAPTTRTVGIRTLNSDSDWAEGDGSNWSDYNWSEPAGGSIYAYAEAHWRMNDNGTPADTTDDFKEIDPATSVPWKQEDGTPVSNYPSLPANFTNSVDFAASDADHGSYVGVVLDAVVYDDLVNNAKNRGLRTYQTDSSYNNSSVYFREQSGGANTPYLEVTVVPEPFSLALLGLGGLGLLIRRKRR
jgi:hypothetical protein